MLTSVISFLLAKKWAVPILISWKHTFKMLSEEGEIARKKKQALDNLLSAGRISQSTHQLFNEELNNAIAEVERQQKALLEKMNLKMEELKEQIKTLEILFANFEIQHVTGEVDEEEYQREINLLSAGLETARHELDIIKEAINQLAGNMQTSTDNPIMEKEKSQPDIKTGEELAETVKETSEPPAEHIEISVVNTSQTAQEESTQTENKEENKNVA